MPPESAKSTRSNDPDGSGLSSMQSQHAKEDQLFFAIVPARPDLQDGRGKARYPDRENARAMPSWYPSRKPVSKALLKAPMQAGQVLNCC